MVPAQWYPMPLLRLFVGVPILLLLLLVYMPSGVHIEQLVSTSLLEVSLVEVRYFIPVLRNITWEAKAAKRG